MGRDYKFELNLSEACHVADKLEGEAREVPALRGECPWAPTHPGPCGETLR